MYKYQCVYTLQSKTHHVTIDSLNEQGVRDFFQKYIVGDLIEIRKEVHTDKTIKKDDGDYKGYAKVILRFGIGIYSSFRIPKIKKSYSPDVDFIISLLKVDGKKPEKVEITLHKN